MHYLVRNSLLALLLVTVCRSGAQCTYSCDTYQASEIPFSMYPATGDTLQMLDDEITTNLPIGFNFEFYCTTYNQLRICSNGFITFDYSFISGSSTPYAQNLPSTVTPNGVIAWNWNDLDPSQGGTITYTTSGTTPNQKFIVTFSNVPLWTPQNPPSTLRNTGQIVLHEGTQMIEIHIKEATNNGWLWHTEGIEDPSATKGVSVGGRNLSLWTASLSSHLFSPYVTGPAPQVSGDMILCQGEPASYATTTLSNAMGYQWYFPPGWAGTTSHQTTVTTVAGASGVVSVAAIYTCGNSPSATIAVNVVPAPTVALSSSGPSLVCSGKAFSIVPSGASFYTVEPGNLTGPSDFTTFPMANTVYTVSGYSISSGCYAVNTVTVAAAVKPSPTITVNSGTICRGTSFTIVPAGATQYTFSSVFPIVSPQVPGVYTYSVWTKASNGCISEAAVSTVSVAPLPVITILPDNATICKGDAITLHAQGAQTYTWTGLSGGGPTVSVSPPFSMVYSVVGKDHNGCVSHRNASLQVEECSGLAEGGATGLRLFPNPAKERVVVNAREAADYYVSDQLGRILSAGNVFPGESTIELPARGILYVTFIHASGNRRFMLVSE